MVLGQGRQERSARLVGEEEDGEVRDEGAFVGGHGWGGTQDSMCARAKVSRLRAASVAAETLVLHGRPYLGLRARFITRVV